MFRKLFNNELKRLDTDAFKASEKAPAAIILDNIRSQHNIGSAFRTADAFRLEKIWLCGICATPPTPEMHKSALGAEFSVDWEYCAETLKAVRRLKAEGWTIVSLEQTEGAVQLQDFRPEKGRKYALILGNEVEGVRQDVVNASDFALEIPQFGTKHSLNVSVSAGVALWQFISQRPE